MWRVDPGPLTPFCIITLRLPNWGVSISAPSVTAAEPTDNWRGRIRNNPPARIQHRKEKKYSQKSTLKLNFLKIGSRCVQMASFSTALASSDLCSFCPQWGKHEVQCLVRVGAVVFSSTAPLSTAWSVWGACRSQWMRIAGWPDPALGKTSQWWNRTYMDLCCSWETLISSGNVL